MIGIYAITHVASGRCYIGSSIAIERRFKEHLKDLRGAKHFNPHLQHAWSMYGEDAFAWSVVEATDYETRLPSLEQMHLDAHRPNVYNADGPVDCPWRGKKRSPEQSAKLSAARLGKPHPHTPEQRAKIIASNRARTGTKMSPESIEKTRQANLGRKRAPFSEETKRRMSEAAKKRPPVSAQTRAKQRAASLGRKWPQSQVVAMKERWALIPSGQRAHNTRPHSTAAKLKMSVSHKLDWARRKAAKVG